MTEKQFLKYFFRVLINPSYWITVKQYSKEWNKKFLELLETEKFHILDDYCMKIGGHTVWIKNFPYASFHNNKGFMPSRMTVMYARDLIIKQHGIDIKDL